MRKVFMLSMIMLLTTALVCSGQNSQAQPETVAEALFAAARSGECKNLATLIDTNADSDCRRIAQAAIDESVRKSFMEYFAKGKVNGKPVIKEDKALVNILFGPNGSDEETFEMVKKNGKWYLQSF